MAPLELVFWLCFLLVVHTYLLYPVLLVAASSSVQAWHHWKERWTGAERARGPSGAAQLPSVSVIIPAYNEERHLPAKLANVRSLDYPSDRLEVLFVSDGSTDGTNAILGGAEGSNIRALYLPTRGGKPSALNHAVRHAQHDILVFSDAATQFAPEALQMLVRHFADPRIGVVCGALQFQGSAESRQTEGIYWRYESRLRLMESHLGVSLTASGAIYAIRRQCFVPLSPDTLVEDLVVPMNARRLGYRVLYDPEATAMDFAASTVAGEFTRRVRVATGSFRALRHLAGIPLSPLTAFAFFSHKLLRWVLPFLLIGMLVSSVALLDSPLYRALFAAQVLFYAWGAVGFLFRQRIQGVRYALIAYYLLAIHLAFLVGFLQYLFGRSGVEWRRVQ